MQLRLDVKGLREMEKALRQYPERAERALAGAMYTEAERIMAEAKRLTPVDTGTLRASGHVQEPKVKPGRIEVVMGFGGPAAPYAIYVHENLEAHHTVGQAKFLETPLMRAQRGLANRLAVQLRKFL